MSRSGVRTPAAAPVRPGRAVDLTDLADDVWVGGRPGSAWFTIVRHSCRAVGFDPRVSLPSDDYRAVQAFVAAGPGVAVIPGLAVVRAPAGVEVRPLRAGAPVRRISAAYPDSAFQPPVVHEMIEILERVTQRLRNSRPPARHGPARAARAARRHA